MDSYIIDTVRTPRGLAEKGNLKDIKPIELLTPLYQALQQRTDINPNNIEDVILGCSSPTGAQGSNIAKVSALYAGLPDSVSGAVVSRFCCSGLDAINQTAATLHTGINDVMIAGGVESLSHVPLFADKGPWFADPKVAAKTGFIHMGVAADLLATRRGYSREQLDTYAVRSHQRAAQAQQENRFSHSIIDIDGMDKDETVRNVTLEKMATLPAVFENLQEGYFDQLALKHFPELSAIEHNHHVGCAPQQTDAAALMLMANEKGIQQNNLTPRARITTFYSSSSNAVQMLEGHISAAQHCFDKTGLTPDDIDIYEVNESFSATALNFQEQLNIPDEKFNPNGGAIALGHPLGATGPILTMTALDELERTNKKTALIAIPGGAGVGVATLIERV